MERIGWPGRVPVHARHPPHRLSRQAVDDPAVRRLRQRPADQRALQDDPRRGRRRPVGRLRHAHPDGPRLRRRARARRGGSLRRRDRLRGRHAGAVRRHRPGRHHDVDDDLAARPCRCSACTSSPPNGRAPTPAELNGTLQTDIFKEYIAQKEWIYPPEPHLKLIGDLMEYVATRHPGVQAAVGVRLPHPGGRSHRRAGARVHPRRRVRLRRAGHVARAGRRPVRARPVVLLRRAHRLLRGDREAARGAPDLGALDARRLRREDRSRPVAALPHPDRRRLADRAAAGQQHRAHRGRGARRGAGRHELAAHQRAGRGARAAVGEGGPDRACAPSR